ncbi:hypothetical protein H9P43_000213 [Blastocladiella emersonii ATCC 22665]|nr:hypothetical protein H9P43_000213 [Blastocladiella emersonii ATCC 22665]
MNFLRRGTDASAAAAPLPTGAAAGQPPSSSSSQPAGSAPSVSLDPYSASLEPPAVDVDDEAWFANAHDQISRTLSMSLQTLQLWEQLRLRQARLQTEAQHLMAARDHLASYARYLDEERLRLDHLATRIDARDARRAAAQAAFDDARVKWCVAAGLDPATTFAVPDLGDDEEEEDDEMAAAAGDDAQSRSGTPAANRTGTAERAAGFVGSALKTAFSLTGAGDTISKLDRAYQVRDRVGGMPLLGSIVNSALHEEDEDAAAAAPQFEDADEPVSRSTPPRVVIDTASEHGASATVPLDDTRSEYSAISGSVRTSSTSSGAASGGADSGSSGGGGVQGMVASAAGAVLRRAASVASLSLSGSTASPTSAPATTSQQPAKTLRVAASQPHLRGYGSSLSTTGAAATGTDAGSTSARSSPSASPDLQLLRNSAVPRSTTPTPRPMSMFAAPPASTTSSTSAAAAGPVPVPYTPRPLSMYAGAVPPPQQQVVAGAYYQQQPPPYPYPSYPYATGPGSAASLPAALGLPDDLGTLLNTVSTVASVAQSVGGASGAVKSVGGWALNKVLNGLNEETPAGGAPSH